MGHWPLTHSKLLRSSCRYLSGRIDVGTRLDENEVGGRAPKSYFRRTKDPDKVLILNQFYKMNMLNAYKDFDTQILCNNLKDTRNHSKPGRMCLFKYPALKMSISEIRLSSVQKDEL